MRAAGCMSAAPLGHPVIPTSRPRRFGDWDQEPDRGMGGLGSRVAPLRSPHFLDPFAHSEGWKAAIRAGIFDGRFAPQEEVEGHPAKVRFALILTIAQPISDARKRPFSDPPTRLGGGVIILRSASSQTGAVERDDDLMFGLLQSRFHTAWALRKGSDLEDRPRYTHTTTFATFPFPAGMTPDVPAEVARAHPVAAGIENAAAQLNAARESWLNPADLIVEVPEVAEGFPIRRLPKDEKARKLLASRPLRRSTTTRRHGWSKPISNSMQPSPKPTAGPTIRQSWRHCRDCWTLTSPARSRPPLSAGRSIKSDDQSPSTATTGGKRRCPPLARLRQTGALRSRRAKLRARGDARGRKRRERNAAKSWAYLSW